MPRRGETVKRETPKLEAHVDFWIRNPMSSLLDCSRTLGVSVQYCGMVRNSDVFKRLYRRKMDGFDEQLYTVRDQALSVASVALERLGEAIRHTQDERFLLDTADKMLGRTEPGGGGYRTNVQVNVMGAATPEELRAAREKIVSG